MKDLNSYELFALCYDRVMEHVSFEKWAKYIQKLIKHYKINPQTILDIGGGTGSLAHYLSYFGYQVDLLDKSKAMLKIAKSKNYKTKTNFYNKDILETTLKKKYDLLLCLHDTINYFTSKEKLKTFFKQTSNLLPQKGLLIIDASSEFNILNSFNGQVFHHSWDDISYIWETKYLPKSKLAKIKMQFHLTAKPNKVHIHNHVQKIYLSNEIIKSALKYFDVLDVFDGFTLKPEHKKTEEIYIIFRKK